MWIYKVERLAELPDGQPIMLKRELNCDRVCEELNVDNLEVVSYYIDPLLEVVFTITTEKGKYQIGVDKFNNYSYKEV